MTRILNPTTHCVFCEELLTDDLRPTYLNPSIIRSDPFLDLCESCRAKARIINGEKTIQEMEQYTRNLKMEQYTRNLELEQDRAKAIAAALSIPDQGRC